MRFGRSRGDLPRSEPALARELLGTGADSVATLKVGTTQGGTEIGSFNLNKGKTQSTFTPNTATFWLSLEVDDSQAAETTYCSVLTVVEDAATTYEAATPWADDAIPDISVAVSTQEVALYFAHESQAPQRIRVTGPGQFVFEAVPFTASPAAWGAGDYPNAVTFYQQRLWYAASATKQDTLWGSKTGSFLDFGLGSGQAADGIEFEMSDRGVIRWIRGARDLLIGADVAEYVLTSEAGVIIPGDIQV